jgi:hypothetical protein
VNLFLNWARRDDFDDAVDAVIGALEEQGMKVTVVARDETFARLLVADPAADGEPDKVEVAADWRSNAPVMLEIGPVLHADDAVANKMAALYGRALARDFLDVDAILASGRYTPERLLDLAAAADTGFDKQLFASSEHSPRSPMPHSPNTAPAPTTSPPCATASPSGAAPFSPANRTLSARYRRWMDLADGPSATCGFALGCVRLCDGGIGG